jgi:hypothetical protein
MARYRLRLDLSDSAHKRLTDTARQEGRLPAEVIRRALNIEDYLREKQNSGAKVLVEDATGTRRQLLIV